MKTPRPIYVSWYETRLGRGAVAASPVGICRVWLPGDDLAEPAALCLTQDERTGAAAEQLTRYFQDELISFELQVDISGLSSFYQQVLELTMQLPYGSVTSYGALAARTGRPRAYRAVGGALRSNPVPIIIPCHRVVAASGTLTGFSGPGGVTMKKLLLSMEGVDMNSIKTAASVKGYAQQKTC